MNNPNETKFPLSQIYFYLTEACNLACRHCWLSPKLQSKNKKYPSLPINLFKSVLEQAFALGLSRVKLTGGEPLMHPEINEIIQLLKSRDLSINIETNGVLCTSKLAKEIASFNNKFVAISLDGANAETHEWIRGIDGCFHKSIAGINNLVQAGIKPQLIFTIMKHNRSQLEEFIVLAEKLGASSIKFNLVQPTGRGEKISNEGESLQIEELIELGKYVNSKLAPNTKLKLYYDLPAAFRPLSIMFGQKGNGFASCGILKIIGILSNGSYALCGIGEHIPELVLGNIATDRLEDVWRRNKILVELREGIPYRFEGVCGHCHLKRMCAASCIAQNYYRTKSLWNSFWFCETAYNKGIFPKTRISYNKEKFNTSNSNTS